MAQEKYLIVWPVSETARVTSKFGYRKAPTAGASTYHKGVDLSVVSGTPVNAANSGTITTGYNKTSGYWVGITGDGITTYYRHLTRATVKDGETVQQGQQIALSGNTGVSTGAHLHFETIVNGKYMDPLEAKKITVKPAQSTQAGGAADGGEMVDITLNDLQNGLEEAVTGLEAAWPIALACLVTVGLLRKR